MTDLNDKEAIRARIQELTKRIQATGAAVYILREKGQDLAADSLSETREPDYKERYQLLGRLKELV